MSINIHKDMIEDSPIAYANIKLLTDNLGNYTSLELISYNKAYERLILRDNEITSQEVKNIVRDIQISSKLISFFDKVKLIKKHTVKEYIDYAKSYFNIDIYYGNNNEFYFRLNKISLEQEKLSSALKNAPFATWLKDRNGKYIDANQQYLDLMNTTYDNIIGKTNSSFVSKENAKNILDIEEKVMKQNKLITYKDESIIEGRCLEIFKWPYTDGNQTVVLGTFGIAIDITDKVKLTKKLEETERQFLDIADNINDILVIRDEEKALYINSAFEKIYKFKPDELYKDINKWYDHWDKVEFDVGNPKPYSYEKADICTIKVSKKGHEDIWLLNKFVPVFNEDKKMIKKIGIVSDITDIKKLELEVDRIKMDFFTNLSHELRTPINLVLSALQLVYLKMDKLDNENREYFSKYCSIIGQNGNRLLRLVNNLIDTTRLDAGCFEYCPKNYNIVSCIEDICTSVVAFVNTNGLEIVFDTDIEEKIIAFDPDNMERIMLNLLSNAIKFNKPNGKIEVTIKCEGEINIIVKDTGIGIPNDKLESIFGRFEQVKSKFKKEKEGSGIGLSLVKSLVEIQNGSITANSKLGEGSEFIITLPNNIIENEKECEGHVKYNNDESKMEIEFSDIYI